MAANDWEGLSNINCLKAKLRKAIAQEGILYGAIVWKVVVQEEIIQGFLSSTKVHAHLSQEKFHEGQLSVG